jgi:aspartate aminotransferase
MTSRRVAQVKPSPTLAITARGIQLRREGKDIVSLSVGEPDFPVFPHVEEAIVAALRKGMTKYTASSGLAELREAISDWMFEESGQRYPVAQIVATAGAKQALYNACQALLDDGDEAVIPNPYWVSYPEMVRLAGGTPVELQLSDEDGWVPRPEALAAVMTDRTRVVMLGSPGNPTGAVWDEKALRGIADVLLRYPKAVILSDDIYCRLVYGGEKAVNLLRVAPELAPRTVLINGCSKAYAMTGLRIGWACGPAAIIGAMNKIQDASTSNASSLSQHAAIAALRGSQEPVEAMRLQFERRRDLMVDLISRIPGMKAAKPGGAYYVFADVREALGARTSLQLSEHLLEKHGVAVVPGSAFGREGYLRFSFATSEDQIRKGLQRVAEGIASL